MKPYKMGRPIVRVLAAGAAALAIGVSMPTSAQAVISSTVDNNAETCVILVTGVGADDNYNEAVAEAGRNVSGASWIYKDTRNYRFMTGWTEQLNMEEPDAAELERAAKYDWHEGDGDHLIIHFEKYSNLQCTVK
jgi:hypothetical protein